MKRDLALETILVEKYAAVSFALDERGRRLWAAAESRAIGFGGDAVVSDATGLARQTIRNGRAEIESKVELTGRIRRPGGGRPSLEDRQPGLEAELERLVSPETRGDAMSPLRWTCKSRAKLAAALTKKGWRVSSTKVSHLLHELGFSLQSPRKSNEGAFHPDRNAQFEHINATAKTFLRRRQPVISVDTKKKELVGNFKNPGRVWCKVAEQVNGHDFRSQSDGQAVPYGIYELSRNCATVCVGKSADTPEFAVDAIAQWWEMHGTGAYPNADRLLILADAGGSNGARPRLWKKQLQKHLADRLGLTVTVCHYPTGCSKYNPIEHRLFSYISTNWAGKPLRTFDTVLNYIRDTTTTTGLKVKAFFNERVYVKGLKVTDAEMNALNLERSDVCPQWNYTIRPLGISA